jgi:hypothetical protein
VKFALYLGVCGLCSQFAFPWTVVKHSVNNLLRSAIPAERLTSSGTEMDGLNECRFVEGGSMNI